ncbi:MAG: hypothetical protein ACW981_11660 [Candidatus Hodarchaeales archaeon]|jgi:hypothetical protein
MILKEFKRMLHNLGYNSQDMTEEPPNQPNPTFAVIRDKKNVISLVIFGSVFSYVVERAIRFFRYFSVVIQSIEVYDISSEENLFNVRSQGAENIFQELQDRLVEKNWENYDFKFVVKLGTASKSTQLKKVKPPTTIPSMMRPTPVTTTKKYVTPFKPSPVMLKSRKLSQLKRRISEEIDLTPTPPVQSKEKEEKTEEELQEEILKSLTDAPLNEDERTILKEILKHPKRKVQSNHIKKKTGLDQEVIRATLRQLVNKNILRVSSGWYILKKSISTPLSSKAAQAQAKKPLVRSEARIRRLRAQIEAESFGDRDNEEEDMYPERPAKAKKSADDLDESPFSEEQEFYSPITDEDDNNTAIGGGGGGKKTRKISEFEDDVLEDEFGDEGFESTSLDEEL